MILRGRVGCMSAAMLCALTVQSVEGTTILLFVRGSSMILAADSMETVLPGNQRVRTACKIQRVGPLAVALAGLARTARFDVSAAARSAISSTASASAGAAALGQALESPVLAQDVAEHYLQSYVPLSIEAVFVGADVAGAVAEHRVWTFEPRRPLLSPLLTPVRPSLVRQESYRPSGNDTEQMHIVGRRKFVAGFRIGDRGPQTPDDLVALIQREASLSPETGGEVDVIVAGSTGTLRWHQRKPSCAADGN